MRLISTILSKTLLQVIRPRWGNPVHVRQLRFRPWMPGHELDEPWCGGEYACHSTSYFVRSRYGDGDGDLLSVVPSTNPLTG